MITSRFPIWRTNPAGFEKSGYWPILTGVLAVLIFVPLVGVILVFIAEKILSHQPETLLSGIGIVLALSFIFTWAPLLVVIPLSGLLAKRGFGGWVVAIISGLIVGVVMYFAIEGGPPLRTHALICPALGVCFSLIYWLAIRSVHLDMIGVTVVTIP